jgi:hypothetical protein
MKKLIVLLSLGFMIISGAMIYLLTNGISLHMATLIKPSVASSDLKNVAQALVLRMYPEFQSSHYILWGRLPEVEDEGALFLLIKEEYQRIFHRNVQLIPDASKSTIEELKSCASPCWIFTAKDRANELEPNEFINGYIKPLSQPYINVTIIPFATGVKAPAACLNEKRLKLECLTALAIEGAERKIKTSDRYFFLKKYNEKDFFLFIQERKKTPDR